MRVPVARVVGSLAGAGSQGAAAAVGKKEVVGIAVGVGIGVVQVAASLGFRRMGVWGCSIYAPLEKIAVSGSSRDDNPIIYAVSSLFKS